MFQRDKACQTDFPRTSDDYIDRSSEIDASVEVPELEKSCQTNFSLGCLEDAVESGNVELVREILLENSVTWNRQDYLHYLGNLVVLATAVNKDEKIHRLLIFIEFGTEDKFVNTFIIPILKGKVDLLKLYTASLSGIVIVSRTYYIGSLAGLLFCRFNMAARKNVLKLLVERGLVTFTRSIPDSDLIHDFIQCYVRKDDTDAAEIAEILLNLNSSVSRVDTQGKTPLYHAVSSENLQLVSLLIDRGANVNQRVFNALTCLHKASAINNASIAKLLLENGADVDAQDSRGFTPLHHACACNHERVVSLLIEKGADVSAESAHDGRIPPSHLKFVAPNYDTCVRAIVREYSKRVFSKNQTSEKMIQFILHNFGTRYYYIECMTDLKLMLSIKFYDSHSYYSIFEKSIGQKKFARLLKNKELILKFLDEVGHFKCYWDVLLRNFEEAVDLRDRMNDVEARLYSVFRSFLPSLVIRRLADYLKVEDLPL